MTKKPFLILLIFINISIISNIALVNEEEIILDQEKSEFRSASSTTLDYLDYVVKYSYCDSGDYIEWDFEGSNSLIGIKVQAMDYDNYDDFSDGIPYSSYELSDGSYYKHDGEWDIPYNDEWYIVFINDDGDMQTTVLEYDVYFHIADDYTDPYPYFFVYMILIIALIAIAAFFVIALPIIIVKKVSKNKDKRRPASPSVYTYADVQRTPPATTLPASQPLPVGVPIQEDQFCSECGSRKDQGAVFCRNCGSKFV